MRSGNENQDSSLILATPNGFNLGTDKTAIVASALGFGSSSRADLHFVLNSNSDNSSYTKGTDTKMIISNNGNVGIGTLSPLQRLHVNGGALVSSLAGTGSRMVVADATGVLSTIALPTIVDGSETKVNAGTNVTVTGLGTTASPYVVNSPIETASQTPSTTITASATQVAVLSTNVQGALGDLATAVKTAGNNIYIADGTLGGNRTVSQGSNNLNFSGSGKIISGNILTGSIPHAGRLSVVTSTNSDIGFTVMNDATSAIGNKSQIGFRTQGSVPSAGIQANIDAVQTGSNLETALVFSTYNGGSDMSERMRITSNGNALFSPVATSGTTHFTVDGTTFNIDAVNNRVGIGTNAPSHNLEVVGAINTPGSFRLRSGNENQDVSLILSTPNGFSLGTNKTAIIASALGFGSGSRADLHFVLNSSSDNANSFTKGTDTKMIIMNNGNVGIGTVSPGTKLAVVGLPIFADNAAASSLAAGDFYRTASGVVMVRF